MLTSRGGFGQERQAGAPRLFPCRRRAGHRQDEPRSLAGARLGVDELVPRTADDDRRPLRCDHAVAGRGDQLEDPQTILMRLREGVTFHDGWKLDAASLKYQFDSVRKPKSKAWTAGWLAPLASLEIVDERTLRWKSNAPWASFSGVISTVPGLCPVGRGAEGRRRQVRHPARVRSLHAGGSEPGQFPQAQARPNWWFAKASGHPEMPCFDGIHVLVIPDPAVRLANLRAGKMKLPCCSTSHSIAALRNDPTVNLYRFPGPHLAALRVQHDQGGFPGYPVAQGGRAMRSIARR